MRNCLNAQGKGLIFVGMFFLMFFLVLSLFVNADSQIIKNYDKDTKTAKFSESSEEIAEIKLLSEQHVIVPRGYQQFAEFEIGGKKDYEEVIKKISLYSIKDNMEEIERQVDIKYLSTEFQDIPIYELVCNNIGNGTQICENKIIGYLKEEVEVWKDFENKIKKDEFYKIGLFMDVQKGDYIEWIPEIYGVEIEEWATLSESIKADLVHVWNFEEGSGTNAQEVVGNISNGTITGAVYRTGREGDCLYYDGNDYVTLANTNGLFAGTNNNFTISLWFNSTTSSGSFQLLFAKDTSNYLGLQSTAGNIWVDLSGADMGGATGLSLDDGSAWHNIVVTANETSTPKLYLDGVLFDTGTRGSISANVIYLGRSDGGLNNFTGEIDEVYVWNRTLDASEVLELNSSFYSAGASDTCTCPGDGNNWEINMSDYCTLTSDCDLGVGNISFTTDAGNFTIYATLNVSNFGNLSASSILYLNDSMEINIG